MKIFINFASGIHQYKEPLDENGKIKSGWIKKEISDLRVKQIRDNLVSIDYSKKTGEVSFNEDKLNKRNEEQKIISEKQDEHNFAKSLLDFFLEIMLTLTSDQRNLLMAVKEYYREKGNFPPLKQLATADPELWQKISGAIESGDLPPLPESLAKQLA